MDDLFSSNSQQPERPASLFGGGFVGYAPIAATATREREAAPAPVQDIAQSEAQMETETFREAAAEVFKEEKTEGNSALQSKLQIVARALSNMEQSIVALRKLLEEDMVTHEGLRAVVHDAAVQRNYDASAFTSSHEGRVIEGVFDGSQMVGADGKPYAVPPNYASKSKLVEGDMLKLTITPTGTFIYKQIGPIDRERVVGVLGFDETTGEYYVANDTDKWHVLKASVTYYKGHPGDETVVLLPKDSPATWAAVENIIARDPMVG